MRLAVDPIWGEWLTEVGARMAEAGYVVHITSMHEIDFSQKNNQLNFFIISVLHSIRVPSAGEATIRTLCWATSL